MIIVTTCVIAIAVIAFVLGVRPKDLPAPEPESPFLHFDERKAAIYENLRDLQFEYRVGKLSDQDYQATKKDLQKELATVLAEVDRVKASLSQSGPQPVAQPIAGPLANARGSERSRAQGAPREGAVAAGLRCPHCGARFERALKFCGECGKPMKEATA
jgi:hypothetical protein